MPVKREVPVRSHVAIEGRERYFSTVQVLRPSADPAGMMMSQKLDGMNATFDGRRLTSLSGADFKAPDWFLAGLPAVPLVGELWAGCGGFERVQSAVRGDWQGIRLAVFDNPERAEISAPHAFEIEQIHCFGLAHLQSFFEEVVSGGGEGVILRFESFMQKFKGEADEEATVIGYRRKAGVVTSIVVTNERGEFALSGLSDGEKWNPPAIGALVTFAFQGVTARGIPRCAKFLRVRPAVTVRAA